MGVVEDFIRNPAEVLQRPGNITKSEWRELADHYGLEIEAAARKEVVREAVLAHLRAEEVLGEQGGDVGEPGSSSGQTTQESEAMQLARMQMQLRREEMAHELELARLRGTARERDSDDGVFYKARGWVPNFSEVDPEDFFTAFEEVATSLKWERGKWALLAQTAFPGKAQSAYLALDSVDRKDYLRVKEEVLRAYEVTSEHYRVKFRGMRKAPGRRFAEYLHDLDRSLTKWWRALGADTLEKVREATLMEQFLIGVAPEVKVYLSERRVTAPAEAASLAEDFVLVSRQGREASGRAWRDNGRPRPGSGGGGERKVQGRAPRCLRCGNPNHLAWQCRSSNGGGGGAESGAAARRCYNCGQTGHLSPDCPRRAGLKKGKQSSSACVLAVARQGKEAAKQREVVQDEEGYDYYTRPGHVVIGKEGRTRVPVRILRDSGTGLNLILRGMLPKLEEKGMRFMKGIGGGVDAPLVEANLEVEGKRLRATLAVVDELPMPGVDVLLGNKAGGRMEIKNFLGDAAEDVGEVVKVESASEGGRKDGRTSGEGEASEQRAPVEVLREQREVQRSQCLGQVREYFSNTGVKEGRDEVRTTAAVTRAMSKRQDQQGETLVGLGDLFSTSQAPVVDRKAEVDAVVNEEQPGVDEGASQQCVEVKAAAERGEGGEVLPMARPELIQAQRSDPDLAPVWAGALTVEEAEKQPTCFYVEGGVLKRKWRDSRGTCEDHQTYHQVVVPKACRQKLVQMAHEETAAHLGARKTGDALLSYFFWRGLRRDVSDYVKSCHVCQVSESKRPVRAPLQPIPVVGEPFDKVIVDVVGPLPRTGGGNEYLLTLMCAATRYADAIPISSCKARKIVPKIVDIFSKFGMPKILQTDRGSNFMGKYFQRALREMGVSHVTSTAYHPQSQGCLERWHGTLKGVLTKFCYLNAKDWDEGVQVALYAIRTAKHEGLGYSPFELMFGRKPRENLRLVCEGWEEETEPQPLADYVSKLDRRMKCAHDIARQNLVASQDQMKVKYDKKSKSREFKVGELVLLFDNSACRPLQAKYKGPFEIERRLGPVNYLLSTPGRKQSTKAVHVNLIKPYRGEVGSSAAVCTGADAEELPDEIVPTLQDFAHTRDGPRLTNSRARRELGEKLGHLETGQRQQLLRMLDEFPGILQDTPTRTHILQHDVTTVGEATPVRQYPHRTSPEKKRLMREEVRYLLENGLAAPSTSPWASPCLLVKKEDGSPRLCTDYRRLNRVTVEDPYPMKRIDDLVDQVSGAKFLTSLDLLKGYWQVGLTDRAREASAFVTPDGHYEYLVMPFGMRNSSATFQSLVDRLVSGLEGVTAYVDDLLVVADSWEDHLQRLRALFSKLAEANLTINLAKCEFAASTVRYLGHRVGHGGIRPLDAKVADVLNFKAPKTRKGLRSFLGLIGFYRRFCKDFAQVASPLTDLLSERRTWNWSAACEKAFEDLKALLASTPVLQAPDFTREFVLYVDASDRGIGGMLGQEHEGTVKPVAYMSKKLLKHQRGYSVVEKEALALLKCMEKFDVYLDRKVTVYSDHNPLQFLESMKLKNARLARWALALQEKEIVIRHVSGRENVVADALSRPN